MKRTTHSTNRDEAERARAALGRRVRQFYVKFNRSDWNGCYALIDPQLIQQGKVKLATYSELLREFKEVYGGVNLWQTRLSLHLNPTAKQGDKRPFAYVYVIWQDDTHGFHMFRERWIKENDRWFTRVVGLVPNNAETASRRD